MAAILEYQLIENQGQFYFTEKSKDKTEKNIGK